jgi:NAD(P)-dependent dehydrogenase (short-subunit alcohol dehydrogenase family)
LLQATPDARVVVVSSSAQILGQIAFDDLDWHRRAYRPWRAYGQSKLANMMFALELQRRLAACGSALKVTASHPGWTSTDLMRTAGLWRVASPYLAMTPHDGALTTLRAATDPTARGGDYWGPAGLTGMSGPPVRVRPSRAARDEAVAARLFDVSERLAGVSFGLPAAMPERVAA